VSGDDGLKIASSQQLSLITLNVSLPGMDGWGFLNGLHEFSDLAVVPIVITTEDADTSLALTRGAAAVLNKPISREALQQSLDALGLSPDAHRTRRVLIADNDPETVDVIERFLTRPLYVIECASTKDEAIDMACRLHPDLILVNPTMEEFSGYQVVLALQDDETAARIPVLVLTGKQITHQNAEAVDSDPSQPVSVIGANNFDRPAILDAVRRALAAGVNRLEE
jgi:CheY-like chemotaxis protein